MASEDQSGQYPSTADRSQDRSLTQEGDEEYPVTGFFPLDKWSKILLALIAIFSLGIFAPVFLDRGLTIIGAPWLFYAYPISIIILSGSWLILTYTVVE